MASETSAMERGEASPGVVINEARDEQETLAALQERLLENGMPELQRMLVHGVWMDYDYLDVQEDEVGYVEYVCWDEGDQPGYDVHLSLADRYDLRNVTLDDLGHQDR